MNTVLFEIVLVVVMIADIALLGTSRIPACIRIVAAQGITLGLLPVVVDHAERPHIIALAAITVVLRGFGFPWLLSRSLRMLGVPREIHPPLGYAMSTVLGVVILGYCFWLGARFEVTGSGMTRLVLPVALATILIGLMITIVRRHALMQVIGYLALENGIYALGVGLSIEEQLIVELGVLLDVFVGVFVMGIALHHLHHEIERPDVDLLDELKH